MPRLPFRSIFLFSVSFGVSACGGSTPSAALTTPDAQATPPTAQPVPPTPPPAPPPPPPPSSDGGGLKGTPWSEYFAGAADYRDISISAGDTVALDVCDLDVGVLRILGTLSIADAGIGSCATMPTMSAESVRVVGESGHLEIGTADRPLETFFELTLTGQLDPGADVERRDLIVMHGGRLDIHGASAAKTAWTQLSATAVAGETELRLASSVDWEPGDRLVLASSSLDPFEAERIEVSRVSADGRTLELVAPLLHDHYAGVHRYGGRELDLRTEIGLLSHTVVIQGDANSVNTRIGGHIMVMNKSAKRPELTPGLREQYDAIGRPRNLTRPAYALVEKSEAYVEGVELRRMGQMGRPGRYSFHWHMVDDGSGQYIRNSSIHSGFQRAVNVHATDGVSVESNVGFDIFNHMFVWAEEGDEMRNRFVGNLAVLNKQPPVDALAFDDDPDDDNFRDSIQEEDRPGLFWGANSYNTIRDNHAAGSWMGQGFFLDIQGVGGSYAQWGMGQDGTPAEKAVYGDVTYADHDMRTLPEGCDFKNNTAHSIYASQLQTQSNRGSLYPSRSSGWGVFTEDVDRGDQNKPYRKHPFKCTLSDFTAYKTEEGGAWLENASVLDGAIFSDSNIGVLMFDSVVDDTVVVGQTPNRTGGTRDVDFIDINGAPYGSASVDFSKPVRFRGGVMVHPSEKDFHVRSEPAISTPRYGSTPDVSGLNCVGIPACLFVPRNQKLTPRSLTFRGLECRDVEDCLALDPKSDDQIGSVVDVDGSIGGAGAEIAVTDPAYNVETKQDTVRILDKRLRGFAWPLEEAVED